MNEYSVNVDRTSSPAQFSFQTPFNVAVPFIDNHLKYGRQERVAIYTADSAVTYKCLAEQVNRCGNALLNQGLKPGDRLMLVIKDTPAFFYLFWGAIKTGIVPVPANSLLRSGDYAYMLETTKSKAICFSPEYRSEVVLGLSKTSHKPKIVVIEGCNDEQLVDLETIMNKASPSLTPYPAAADRDCFWLFSSGSTGKPKAVVHRHRDMVVTSELYGVGCLDITENDRFYSAAKLFFAYGLGNAMTLPLWVGGSTILDWRKPTPDTTIENIERYRPTLYFGIPTLYSALLNAATQLDRQADLSSLRICVSAGEALPAEILRRWQKKTNVEILDGIGSTEALHIFITNLPGQAVPGASGQLVPGYNAKILNENDNPVEPGSVGRLLIKGPSTARCYWGDAEQTSKTMVGEWLETGDTYFQDQNGIFIYCGRNDDMMKVGGIWCSPFEIEAKLIEHPAVLESAVISQKDDAGLDKPTAFVVLKDPTRASDELKEELTFFIKSNLAKYKYPRQIFFIETLPKTATGKIQRFKLRKL